MLFSSTWAGGNTRAALAGNQLAAYVSELVTACEDRAQELGFDGLDASERMLRPAPEYQAAFDQALRRRSRVCVDRLTPRHGPRGG